MIYNCQSNDYLTISARSWTSNINTNIWKYKCTSFPFVVLYITVHVSPQKWNGICLQGYLSDLLSKYAKHPNNQDNLFIGDIFIELDQKDVAVQPQEYHIGQLEINNRTYYVSNQLLISNKQGWMVMSIFRLYIYFFVKKISD